MFVPRYSGEHTKEDCIKELIDWNITMGAGTYIRATNQNNEEVFLNDCRNKQKNNS